MSDEPIVVCVDPDRGVREETAAMLSDAGLTGVHVADAAAALDACRTRPVACVVAEHRPPSLDCLDLLDRLGASGPPVVVYTDGSESLAGRVVAAGARAYVPRTDGAEVLLDRVRAAIADDTLDGPAGTRAVRADRHCPDGPVVSDGVADPGGDAAGGTNAVDADDRLSLLVEQSPLAIVEWTVDFEIVGWNPAAVDLFGYDCETAIGADGTDLVVPVGGAAPLADTWPEVLEDATDSTHSVTENVRADGTRIVCEWHNRPIVEDGSVVGVVSFVREVTEEVRRADVLEALQSATRDLMRAGEPTAIAEEVVAAARDVLGQSFAAVRLYDPERGVLEVAAATEGPREMLGELPAVGPDDGLMWDAFAARESRVYDDIAGERTVYREEIPFRSAIFEPLGEHGLLVFTATGAGAFDDPDRHLASVLASTARAALDRAEREAELRRRNAVVEAVGDGVYVLDRAGRVEMVTDALVATTGYDRATLLGEHVSLLLADGDAGRWREAVGELIDSGDTTRTHEVTIETAGGDRLPCEATISLLPAAGSEAGAGFDGVVVVVRDVSERVRIERELRERTGKIEALHSVASQLDDCESAAAVYDLAVAAASEVLNFAICVAVGTGSVGAESAAVTATGDRPDAARAPLDEGLAALSERTGETVIVDDVREHDDAMPASDQYRSVLSTTIRDHGIFQAVATDVGAFDDADADLAELLLAHVADALDRLQFESVLRTERDRFAGLFENVPDPVVAVTHVDGTPIVREVNPAFEDTFGYAESAIVGEDLDEYIVPPDKRAEARELDEQGLRGEVVEREVTRRTADGLREFLLSIVPVDVGDARPSGPIEEGSAPDEAPERADRDDDGPDQRPEVTTAYGVYTDITERKRHRKRIAVLNRVLRHDLRNGMDVVRGTAELIADGTDDDRIREYAGTIVDRADELAALAGNIRTIERTLDLGADTTGPVDVVEDVRTAVATLREDHSEATIDISAPERALVQADDLLGIAVRHVLENAIEHNDRPAPHVVVTVDVDAESGTVTVRVADDGPGIPEVERDLLAGDQEITQLRHASGVGLWLVDWVVTESGGRLSFDDNDPRGTVVTLELPRAATADQVSPAAD